MCESFTDTLPLALSFSHFQSLFRSFFLCLSLSLFLECKVTKYSWVQMGDVPGTEGERCSGMGDLNPWEPAFGVNGSNPLLLGKPRLMAHACSDSPLVQGKGHMHPTVGRYVEETRETREPRTERTERTERTVRNQRREKWIVRLPPPLHMCFGIHFDSNSGYFDWNVSLQVLP